MPWTQAHVVVPQDQTDLVELTFESMGAVSITLGDAKDDPVMETLPEEIKLWPTVKVTGLFEFNPDGLDQLRQQMNQAFNRDISQQVSLEILQDQPWERAWLEHFKPMQFGRKLWICPTGQTHTLNASEADATIIELDPGLAFGTGTHPTTALCLEWLDSQDLTEQLVIDYGCGSGILAIAALKLGAAKAIGIDHDPQALIASQDNAKKNAVADRLEVLSTNDRPAQNCDLLMANILAGVLIELAETLVELIRPGGKIVLSGILQEQTGSVIKAFEHAIVFDPAAQKEDWMRLTGTRKA